MASETWIVVIMVAAALLPAVLLGLLFLGDRVARHPRYRAVRWKLYEFQRSHPAAFTGLHAVLMLPVVVYFAREAAWLNVVFFVLQWVAVYYGARHAVPPFSESTDGWQRPA